MMDSVIVRHYAIIVTMNNHIHLLDNTVLGKRIEDNAVQLRTFYQNGESGIFEIRRNGFTGIIPNTTKRLILRKRIEYFTELNTLRISSLPNLVNITIGRKCLQNCKSIQIEGMEYMMAIMNRS